MYYRKNSMFCVLLAIYCYVGVVASYKIVSTDDVNTKHSINYYEYNSDNHGNYNFSFKSPDIEREESGQVIDVGQPGQYIRVTGKYSYIEDTREERRQLKTIYYTADKDGYRIDENRSASSDEPPELGFRDTYNNLDLIRTLVG